MKILDRRAWLPPNSFEVSFDNEEEFYKKFPSNNQRCVAREESNEFSHLYILVEGHKILVHIEKGKPKEPDGDWH